VIWWKLGLTAVKDQMMLFLSSKSQKIVSEYDRRNAYLFQITQTLQNDLVIWRS
jgi:hypothetical protein